MLKDRIIQFIISIVILDISRYSFITVVIKVSKTYTTMQIIKALPFVLNLNCFTKNLDIFFSYSFSRISKVKLL